MRASTAPVDRAPRDRNISRWRALGVLSLAGSGAGFLIGLGLLYHLEGPGSTPTEIELAGSGGQALYRGCTAALTTAAVLVAIAAVCMHSRLRNQAPCASRLAVALTSIASATLLAILSLQFGVTTVAEKAGVPSDRGLARVQGNTFHLLVLFEHGAADLGGGTSLALLAVATVLTCLILLRNHTWRKTAVAGLAAGASVPILYALNSTYLFMLPFGLWQLLLAACLLFSEAAP